MPRSKSKRPKVVARENAARQAAHDARRAHRLAFERVRRSDGGGLGPALAAARGYTAITLDDIPESMRADTEAAMRDWESIEGGQAQLYRKPDGGLSIMAAPVAEDVEG